MVSFSFEIIPLLRLCSKFGKIHRLCNWFENKCIKVKVESQLCDFAIFSLGDLVIFRIEVVFQFLLVSRTNGSGCICQNQHLSFNAKSYNTSHWALNENFLTLANVPKKKRDTKKAVFAKPYYCKTSSSRKQSSTIFIESSN